MNRAEIEALARLKADATGVDFVEAMESVIKALPPSEKTLERVKNHAPADEDVFDFASQFRLFKVGMMGEAVTMWSSCSTEGFSYPPAQVMVTEDEPLVVTVDAPELDNQLLFAASYVTGWVESQGGKLQDLRIWLEPEQAKQ